MRLGFGLTSDWKREVSSRSRALSCRFTSSIFRSTIQRKILVKFDSIWTHSINDSHVVGLGYVVSYSASFIFALTFVFMFYLKSNWNIADKGKPQLCLMGMTNYRIDRIDTHRHTWTRIGTDFDHIYTAKQGQRYESIVSRYQFWANGNW